MSAKKNKLRTSEDVFQRLNWDESYEGVRPRVRIGYHDRFRGLMEIPLEQFHPGGDIPFHRIYYFRILSEEEAELEAEVRATGEGVERAIELALAGDLGYLWDRETRMDLLYHSGEHRTSCMTAEAVESRKDQVRRALHANAEANEEVREMADQRERRRMARERQMARREASSRGYSASPYENAAAASWAMPDPVMQGARTIPIFAFDPPSEAWVPQGPATNPRPASAAAAQEAQAAPEELKVLTYNVLFDFYHPERLHTEVRTEALLEILRQSDADLIALQEVTPPLFARLLATPWIREAYRSSSGQDGRLCEPYGLLLLSRLPLSQLSIFQFSASTKTALIGRVLMRQRPFRFVTLHLTSNHAAPEAAPLRRREQLAELFAHLESEAPLPTLFAGDFNTNGDNPLDALPRYIDLWTLLRTDEGLTFDPCSNPLAALNSATGTSLRLDRVMADPLFFTLFEPSDIGLLGTQPLEGREGLFPSDHYGLMLRANFIPPSPSDLSEEEEEESEAAVPVPRGPSLRPRPTYQTALVVVPPRDLWHSIRSLIANQHCEGQAMPHINLLYGFWPEEHFDEAARLISKELQGWSPFEVALRDFGIFTHNFTYTAWARPESAALPALQAAMQNLFPECDEVSRRSPSGGYTPHMTLGNRILTHDRAQAIVSKWRTMWRPATFQVSEVYLIAREKGRRFEIKRVLPLGPSPHLSLDAALQLRGCFETEKDLLAREAAVSFCRELCLGAAEALSGRREGSFHLVGSSRLESHTRESDIDAVFLGPAGVPAARFLGFAASLLGGKPQVGAFRLIQDAIMPVLQLTVGGVQVDLQYAPLPPDLLRLPAHRLLPALQARAEHESQQQEQQGQPNARALQGILDSELLASLFSGEEASKFTQVLRAVRMWARLRHLGDNSLGFLPGISWAVMVAAFLQGLPGTEGRSSEELLRGFFAHYAGWDWRQRSIEVRLPPHEGPPPAAAEAGRGPVRILTPSRPPRNSARNVVDSTLTFLQEELERAAALSASGGQWEAVLAPLGGEGEGGFARCPSLLRVAVAVEAPEDLGVAQGWLNGHAMSLIAALDRKGLLVRPLFSQSPPPLTLVLLLGLAKKDPSNDAPKVRFTEEADSFARSFEEWGLRPHGATISVTHTKSPGR